MTLSGYPEPAERRHVAMEGADDPLQRLPAWDAGAYQHPVHRVGAQELDVAGDSSDAGQTGVQVQLVKLQGKVTVWSLGKVCPPNLRHSTRQSVRMRQRAAYNSVPAPNLTEYFYLLNPGVAMAPLVRFPRSADQPAGESVLAAMVAGAAIGAVLAILVGAAAFPTSIGPLAYAAIVAVGSIAGSAIGVLAVAARRHGDRRQQPEAHEVLDVTEPVPPVARRSPQQRIGRERAQHGEQDRAEDHQEAAEAAAKRPDIDVSDAHT
jgi:hypothetical protein